MQHSLEKAINRSLMILENNIDGNKCFNNWLIADQNLPDFQSNLKISKNYSKEQMQFCLESVLGISMKLFLTESNGNIDIERTFEESKKDISYIIFEEDFYSWLINCNDKIVHDYIFKLSNDLKKMELPTFDKIYEYFFESKDRKLHGQFFTEIDLAKFIIESADVSSTPNINYNIMDPSCGAGAFIISLIDFYFPNKNVKICGIDNKYFACLMSRISYFKKYKELYNENLHFIPIFWMDFLTDYSKTNLKQIFNNKNTYIGVKSQLEDHADEYITNIINEGLDLVIGNPPYLRIQNLDKDLKKIYEEGFKSAIGRYDLYILFIEHALNNLSDNGKVAFICSNKFMTTKYGKGIREIISKRFELEKVYDFTDTELFDAMVLPCIIVISNTKKKEEFRYVLATRTDKKIKNNLERKDLWNYLISNKQDNFKKYFKITNQKAKTIVVSSFKTNQPSDNDVWHFLPDNIFRICKKIKNNSDYVLDDVADITVGIKTTCDKAFVLDNKNEFKDNNSLNIIHPLLLAPQIEKWKVPKISDKSIIYPYENKNGIRLPINLEDYPEIKSYFNKNKEILESRKYLIKAGRKWFEIWVPQTPKIFEQSVKIVTPDISTNNRFAFDFYQHYCQGTCFVISLKNFDFDFYCYLLGLLNSKMMEFYHKTKLSTNIYAKRYRYWTSHISRYPILESQKTHSTEYGMIVTYVKKIINGECDISKVENKINNLVYKLYGLSNDEINDIVEYLDN